MLSGRSRYESDDMTSAATANKRSINPAMAANDRPESARAIVIKSRRGEIGECSQGATNEPQEWGELG